MEQHLTPYERQRMDNIRKNEAELVRLGLTSPDGGHRLLDMRRVGSMIRGTRVGQQAMARHAFNSRVVHIDRVADGNRERIVEETNALLRQTEELTQELGQSSVARAVRQEIAEVNHIVQSVGGRRQPTHASTLSEEGVRRWHQFYSGRATPREFPTEHQHHAATPPNETHAAISKVEEEQRNSHDKTKRRRLEGTLCSICIDEPSIVCFTSCGHICTCTNCSPKIDKCPICRTNSFKSGSVFLLTPEL